MTSAAPILASSGAESSSSDWMLAIPFGVVLVIAAVCVPWALRARARGRQGPARWTPVVVLLAALGAFAVWLLTV